MSRQETRGPRDQEAPEHGPVVSVGPYVSGFEWLDWTLDRPERWDYVIRVRLALAGDHYELEAFSIERRADGPAVSAEGVRTIPVADVARMAMTETQIAHFPSWPAFALALIDDEGATLRARGIDDDAALAVVGVVYARATLQGLAPVDAVADQLKRSRATATRWVAAARRRGHLYPSTKPTREEA